MQQGYPGYPAPAGGDYYQQQQAGWEQQGGWSQQGYGQAAYGQVGVGNCDCVVVVVLVGCGGLARQRACSKNSSSTHRVCDYGQWACAAWSGW